MILIHSTPRTTCVILIHWTPLKTCRLKAQNLILNQFCVRWDEWKISPIISSHLELNTCGTSAEGLICFECQNRRKFSADLNLCCNFMIAKTTFWKCCKYIYTRNWLSGCCFRTRDQTLPATSPRTDCVALQVSGTNGEINIHSNKSR